MGCVSTPPKGKDKDPKGLVNASNNRPYQNQPPQSKPQSHVNPQNNQSNVISSNNQGSNLGYQNSGQYQPSHQTAGFNITDSNQVRNTLNNSSNQGMINEINRQSNRVLEPVNQINNNIRNSSNSANDKIDSSIKNMNNGIGMSNSNNLAFGLQSSRKVENAIHDSRMNLNDSTNRVNHQINNRIHNMFESNNIIPNSIPYPSKPNFDWAKDVPEQNFNNKFEIVTIPNINIKIS